MGDSGDYKTSNWNNKKEYNRDVNGCFRDCEIIYEALFQVFEDAGDIKITQASLSMTYYRRFHQPFDIQHNENTAFFFDSYFGGRTEAFQMGKVNAQVIDVNSMYPAVMQSALFPDPSKLKVYENPTRKTLNRLLRTCEGLVCADVLHHERTFGFLPVKNDGKLLFPCGNFKGTWNFPEFRFALLHGAIKIKKIYRVVASQPFKSPFAQYVTHLYKKRFETSNEIEIYRIKIFMNSLYGKFAQRITKESEYIEDIKEAMPRIRQLQREGLFISLTPFNRLRNDAWLTTKPTKKVDISFCIPSFASYITSIARVNLLKKMIELEPGNPVSPRNVKYCDTDSIFFENIKNIKSEKQLGGWKLESKTVTEIKGLKNYKYKNDGEKTIIRRIKGVPKNAQKITENSYIYENLVKTKEGLRRGLEPGILIERKKEISGKYEKRIILADGSTKPIILK